MSVLRGLRSCPLPGHRWRTRRTLGHQAGRASGCPPRPSDWNNLNRRPRGRGQAQLDRDGRGRSAGAGNQRPSSFGSNSSRPELQKNPCPSVCRPTSFVSLCEKLTQIDGAHPAGLLRSSWRVQDWITSNLWVNGSRLQHNENPIARQSPRTASPRSLRRQHRSSAYRQSRHRRGEEKTPSPMTIMSGLRRRLAEDPTRFPQCSV